MNTQLATNSPMPAHLADAFGDIGANIRTGVSIPTLGFKNKVWSVRDGDAVKPIMIQSPAGALPSPIVDVVIVAKNPNYSRIFYQGKYSGDSNDPPTCSSSDGITPDSGVSAPQSTTCAACPQNIKGSKLAQDGVTPIKQCGTVQRLAVVPADDLTSKPLLLSFRGNSLFDPDNGDNEKENKYCYGAYERSLQRDGVNNTAKVVTRIQFDTRPHIEGVKLLFSRRDGWITAEQAPLVVAHVKSQAVTQLVTGRINGAAPALAAPPVALTLAPPPVVVQLAPPPYIIPSTPETGMAPTTATGVAPPTAAVVAKPPVIYPDPIVIAPPAPEAVAVAKPVKKPVLKPVIAAVVEAVVAPPALTVEQQIEARIRAQVMAEMAKAAEADAMAKAVDIAEEQIVTADTGAAPSLDDILANWGDK